MIKVFTNGRLKITLIKNTFGECFIFHFKLDFFLIYFPSSIYTSPIHGKALLLLSHLHQVLSDLSFCGLIKILKLNNKLSYFQVSRKRISIL